MISILVFTQGHWGSQRRFSVSRRRQCLCVPGAVCFCGPGGFLLKPPPWGWDPEGFGAMGPWRFSLVKNRWRGLWVGCTDLPVPSSFPKKRQLCMQPK